MTVKELREKLTGYPDNTPVYMDERKTEFAYGLVNGVYAKEISIQDDPYDDDEEAPIESAIILSEE